MITALSQAMTTITTTLGALASCEIVVVGASVFVVFALIGVLTGFFGAKKKGKKG